MTDFAMITDAVERAATSDTFAERDIDEQVKRLHKRVGGFVVKPIAARSTAIADLQRDKASHLEYYRKSCSDLDIKLAACRVTPLCFVPTRAWNEICWRSGLYQLKFYHDTAAAANLSTLSEMLQARRWPGSLAMIILGISAIPITASVISHLGLADGTAFVVCIAAIVAFLGGAVASQHFLERWQTRRNLAKLTDKQLIDVLLRPGKRDGHIGVKLPDPPEEVADTLWKLSSFNEGVEVACVSDAIAVSRVGLHDRIVAYRDSLRCDPIVFVRYQSAVAIVAQWGDFPIEQAVVEECMATAWR